MFKPSRKTLINSSVIILVVLLLANSLSCFKNPVEKTFKPHLSLISWLKREVGGIIFYHRNMMNITRLNNETGFLRSQLFSLREIYLENKRLKDLLTFKQQSALRLVAARVIARPSDSWSSSVIIDKGKYNGIRRSMVVINAQGLVGRVSESADNTSKVSLVNDPSLGISSIVQRSRQEGLVSGTLGAYLIMRYLPEDSDIIVNDLIVTSELSQVYPKGLLVGKVIKIGRELSGLNRYAIVKPAVNCSAIEEVLVIIP
ncbi:MAG: rod shape-determining protein MreC [Candidatus Omnitrophota bacterium]